jgi:hypothetical protein
MAAAAATRQARARQSNDEHEGEDGALPPGTPTGHQRALLFRRTHLSGRGRDVRRCDRPRLEQQRREGDSEDEGERCDHRQREP